MQTKSRICLGIIADDFTGAADAASFSLKGGLDTLLYTKIPHTLPQSCDCIVIALKSRSVEAKEAIHQCKYALKFLQEAGVKHVYFKYCSTFDSTRNGNIGVVLDYLMDELDTTYTILCPSLPINGRTVKNGVLYVNGTKLSESSMKKHPLNPMWDSYIPNLMKEQSQYPCFVVSREELEENNISRIIERYKRDYQKFYLIPDYESKEDAKLISRTFKDLNFISGGSGLVEYLFQKKMKFIPRKLYKDKKKAIILCGSCSEMSKKQIYQYRTQGGIVYKVNSKKLLQNEIHAKDIFQFICSQKEAVLVYSDAIDNNIQELSKSETFLFESKLIEKLMADLSVMASENNFNRIIVAGGETSGAVTMALGYDAFHIGKDVAAGVPILTPLNNKSLDIILKSGNFGNENFFEEALKREES